MVETDSPTCDSVLFASLAADDGDVLLAQGRAVTYPSGSTIFAQDDPGDTLLLINTGRIEISLTSLSGRKSVLNQMGPGEALGEIAMLDGGTRSADATAATDVSGILLYRSDVLAFLKDRPDAMLDLVRELCAKVRNASEMFSTQSQTDASARLARCLLRLGDKWGEDGRDGIVRIGAGFSQSDLGEFAGLSRENVNRHLRRWAEQGLIELDRSGIGLVDEDGLSEIAQI